MTDAKTKVMHDAALRVLERYRSTGDPFAFFLSSWSFDNARNFAASVMSENPRQSQVRIGLERQVRILLKVDGLETLSVYRMGDEDRIADPDNWPALTLSDIEWQTSVSEISDLADLIVLFWG